MRIVPVVVVALCMSASHARAAADQMELMRSMTCPELRDMLMPLHDGMPPEAFVTENSRYVAPTAWTPELLRMFSDEVRRCVSLESRAMMPITQGSMLGNYLRTAEMGVEAHRRRLDAGDPPRPAEQAETDPQMQAVEQARQEAQELERLRKENEAKRQQIAADQERRRKLDAARREAAQLDAQQRRLAQADQAPAAAAPAQPPATPTQDGADCPAFKAHEADLAPLMSKAQADADRMQGKTPVELALAPELACNVVGDQVAVFKAMLGYAQECPADTKVGKAEFRTGLAGMILQMQSQGRQMGCR